MGRTPLATTSSSGVTAVPSTTARGATSLAGYRSGGGSARTKSASRCQTRKAESAQREGDMKNLDPGEILPPGAGLETTIGGRQGPSADQRSYLRLRVQP